MGAGFGGGLINRRIWPLVATCGTAIAVVLLYCALLPPDERLRQAAGKGDTARVHRLVRAGAHVNGADSDGITPLMLASAAGRTETVRELVRLGADVNIKAHRYPGDTALYYAVLNNHPGVIKVLLDAGADPNAKMAEYSMVGIAASGSSVDMLSALLSSPKTDIKVRDAKGNTLDMLVMLSDAPLERKWQA